MDEFRIFLITDNQMENDSHKVDHLNRLKDLSVDLTAFMTIQQPPPVSEEFQVVSPSTSL